MGAEVHCAELYGQVVKSACASCIFWGARPALVVNHRVFHHFNISMFIIITCSVIYRAGHLCTQAGNCLTFSCGQAGALCSDPGCASTYVGVVFLECKSTIGYLFIHIRS